MKYMLTILSVFLSVLLSAQQQVDLCIDTQSEFTYTAISTVPNTTYYWFIDGIYQFGQQLTIDWTNLSEGEHTISVYGIFNECASNTVSYKITVIDCSTIYIPNTFTPDNDGHNDFWFPVGVGWEWIDVVIYDRWGEKVWWSNDINGLWDGSYRNGEYYVQNDVYVYKVTWKGHNNNPETIYGHVTVVR